MALAAWFAVAGLVVGPAAEPDVVVLAAEPVVAVLAVDPAVAELVVVALAEEQIDRNHHFDNRHPAGNHRLGCPTFAFHWQRFQWYSDPARLDLATCGCAVILQGKSSNPCLDIGRQFQPND